MAVLGFEGLGQSLLTLLLLGIWAGAWALGPPLALLAIVMGGAAGKGGLIFMQVSLIFGAILIASVVGLWYMTEGEWGVRALFALTPVGLAYYTKRKVDEENEAKRLKAEALYAAGVREQELKPPQSYKEEAYSASADELTNLLLDAEARDKAKDQQ
ncbi:MAG: hypothetical protein AABX89_06690 [Candidatus Thermoplasmatota archaeon]